MEIPEWTPPILRTLYEDKDMLSRWDADEFLLLERFIFDSRMRTVWNAITKELMIRHTRLDSLKLPSAILDYLFLKSPRIK